MRSPRYTVLIANRNSGAVRRFSFVRLPFVLAVIGLLVVPTLMGLGAHWARKGELESLRLTAETLRIENENYRGMTGELATQVSSLQSAIDDLSKEAQLDPSTRQVMDRLAAVKARPMGGAVSAPPVPVATQSPETTFGVLKDLLGLLEDRLTNVRKSVEGRQALAAALPTLWPLSLGRLTSNYGSRQDPITGAPDFHAGLDLSAERGTPVHATADGTVQFAGYNGNYGNFIEIAHGNSIGTRFGHLSRYAVRTGQRVRKGDVIGYVGATGRTTGPHLHYEILRNGQPINPLRFLGRPPQP